MLLAIPGSVLEQVVSSLNKLKPPNTTSKLQSLDPVIIANFKAHYKHLFLQHVLAWIDEAKNATEQVQLMYWLQYVWLH